jgi:hypothetical protein
VDLEGCRSSLRAQVESALAEDLAVVEGWAVVEGVKP